MKRLIRLAAVTAALLGIGAASAAADSGLTVEPRATTIVFEELTFEIPIGEIVCEVTLHLTFHESIGKTPGALAGEARVGAGACQGGSIGLLSGVRGSRVTGLQGPYHIQFNSFEGTLPGIASVTLDLVGLVFWMQLGEMVCLSNNTLSFTTTGGNPATGLEGNQSGLPFYGGFFCAISSINYITNGSLSPSIEIGLL